MLVSSGSFSAFLGRLEQVERNVGLALVMGFMPSQDLQDIEHGQISLFHWLWQCFRDGAQISIAEFAECFEQMAAGFLEHPSNERRRWNFVVGCTASSEARNQIRKSRFSAGNQPFCGKKLFGDSNVSQLPGYMGPAGTRSPAKNRLWIAFLLDFLEQAKCSRSVELIRGDQTMNGAH